MRQLFAIILILYSVLLSGCATTNTYNSLPNKHLQGFRQLNDMIGCTVTYTNNYLVKTPYRIWPIPTTRFEYQYYKMLNKKYLHKQFECSCKFTK